MGIDPLPIPQPARGNGLKDKLTLANLIDRYTEHVLPDLPASARDYAPHLRWWKEQLGSYYSSDISLRLIDDCKQKLLRKPGPKRETQQRDR